MRTLNKTVLVNFITLLLFSLPTQAFDIENGKVLHNENCVRCHDKSVYTRENKVVHNFQQLRSRIIQCELMAELAWFDEEIDDVTAFLNDAFYHFNLDK